MPHNSGRGNSTRLNLNRKIFCICMKLRIDLIPLMCLAVAVSVAAPAIHADDWPVVRGDVLGTGVAKSPIADNLDVVWKYSPGKDAAFDATAIVAAGVVYIGDSNGTFHAIRRADGTPIWKKVFSDTAFNAGAAI